MQKAFIFDMDGVIVDSERPWLLFENQFFTRLFGKETKKKIGSTVGLNIDTIYEKAAKYGFSMDRDKYYKIYDKQAKIIYSRAEITYGIEELVQKLIDLYFKLGLVSSSRRTWIEMVLPQLSFKDQFRCVISLNDRVDLKSKPHPDGYLEAMKILKSSPETTIILEDSNAGIQAAKAAGAFTIALSQNLIPGYIQEGADMYVKQALDVVSIIEKSY